MKKELTENDIKYPVLSMLFDGPNELAARAEALRDSIIHDLDDDSRPRLRQLEILSALLQPSLVSRDKLYQNALQQVSLADLQELFKNSKSTDSHTKLITTIEQVQKIAGQLSFTINLSLEHTDGNLSWKEAAHLDTKVDVDTTEQLSNPTTNLSFEEIEAWLESQGQKIIDTYVSYVHFDKVTLSINNRPVLKYKSSSVDGRFLALFFKGPEKLKKRGFQLGDIIDLLRESDNYTKIDRRAMQKRYSDARKRINLKISAKTGIDEFICYKDSTFYINQNIFK